MVGSPVTLALGEREEGAAVRSRGWVAERAAGAVTLVHGLPGPVVPTTRARLRGEAQSRSLEASARSGLGPLASGGHSEA